MAAAPQVLRTHSYSHAHPLAFCYPAHVLCSPVALPIAPHAASLPERHALPSSTRATLIVLQIGKPPAHILFPAVSPSACGAKKYLSCSHRKSEHTQTQLCRALYSHTPREVDPMGVTARLLLGEGP